MADDPLTHIERGVPRAWRRLRRIYVAIIALLTILVVVQAFYGLRASNRLSDIQQLEHRGDCRSTVEAEFFIGVADALNAPPAPNPARELAAQEILKAGADMKRLAKSCG